mmetsp:Transcript_6097/g.17046  ORF Transcript_6097/g.17046 Transcript_6097/m.17046 type:complete len:341 (+) Transcript_6097:97-1119(+)
MPELHLEVRLSKAETLTASIEDDETVESLACVIYSMRPDLGEEMRLVHRGRILKPDQVIKELGIQNGDAVAVAKAPARTPAAPAVATAAGVTAPVPTQTAPVAPPDRIATTSSATCSDSSNLAPAAAAAAVEAEPAKDASRPQDAPGAIPTPMIVDGSSASSLLDFAKALEEGKSPPSAEQLAATMRQASQRMALLEESLSKCGQALQMVNMVSAHSLRDFIARVGGEEPAHHEPHTDEQHESTRSFMLKRGDAETHEMHKDAAAGGMRNIRFSGTACSSTAAPLSKEEMDRARNARLARLEEQQAQKRKEKEEADERSKAREAMFNRPFTGAQKPLGRI